VSYAPRVGSFRRCRGGESLLVRARNDPEAFVEFYQAYVERILAFFTRRVLDVETALDLTAETFARALELRQQFRGATPEEEQGWLFAIARTQLSDYWHRGAVDRRAAETFKLRPPTMTDPELERVEDLAGLRHLAPLIADAVAGLPADQRIAVELRVVRELDYGEIAAATGVTQQVARARVSRGLRALARTLNGHKQRVGNVA